MNEDWNKDYQEFVQGSPESVPRPLSRSVRERIEHQLSATQWGVLTKLVGIQALSGAVTFAFCPQFGLGPIGGGLGVMGWVMPYGQLACAALCGSIFLGSCALAASVVLREGELRLLRNGGWQFPLIGMVFVALLMLLSGTVRGSFPAFDVPFSLGWLLSGSVFAYGVTQAGFEVRRRTGFSF